MMRVLIAYESMYGNTHQVAEAIAQGFGSDDEVTVAPVAELAGKPIVTDLLIIGAPTHVHGLPRPASRRSALAGPEPRDGHHKPDADANVDYGVREWLDTLPARVDVGVAAFDTRFHWPAVLVGHPARTIARTVVAHGATQLVEPESFFLDKQEILRAAELERAREWGARLRRLGHESAVARATACHDEYDWSD